MNIGLTIISISIILQLISVLLAFRLIVITKRYKAGVLILTAIALMAFRRFISLYRVLSGEHIKTDVTAEFFACVISLLFLLGIVYVTKLILSANKIATEKEKLIVELQEALGTIKTLHGILPICASCKKIRDDKGYWNQIEAYISAHSQAEFSHSLCKECAKRLYPNIFKENNEETIGESRCDKTTNEA
jgi:hypothetical protein